MAQINWGKQIVAVIVGGAHRVARDMDANVVPARTEPLKTAADLGAVGAVLLGMGIQVMQPRYADYGEAAALASTPYVVEAAWAAISSAGIVGRTGTRPGKYSRPRQPAPQGGRPLDTGGRYPAPVYQNEFKNVQLQ